MKFNKHNGCLFHLTVKNKKYSGIICVKKGFITHGCGDNILLLGEPKKHNLCGTITILDYYMLMMEYINLPLKLKIEKLIFND